MECIRAIFPQHPAACENQYHFDLRKLIVNIFIGHLICMIVGFSMVSFTTGLMQIFYLILLYSSYLTLKRWAIILYFIVCGISTLVGLFSVLFYKGRMFWGYLIILGVQATALYFLYNLDRKTRQSGQIPGTEEELYMEEGFKHMFNTAKDNYTQQREKLLKPPEHPGANGTDEEYLDYYSKMREYERQQQDIAQRKQQQQQAQKKLPQNEFEMK